MKPRTWTILTDAIEAGIDLGYQRAHKHSDTPDGNTVKGHMYQEIMNQICNYFTFDEEEQDE